MATLPSPVKKTKPDGGLRALAAKYFPGLEDKILYLINGESGGNAQAVGDGGAAYGLFQSHYIKPGTSVEDQFKDARRLYDARVKAGGSGFEDWGENNLFEGKKFGALGNNPYPGDSNTGRTVAGPYNPRGHVDQDWHYGDSPGNVKTPKKEPSSKDPASTKPYVPTESHKFPYNPGSTGNTTGEVPGSAGDFNIPNPNASAVYRKSGTSKLPSPVARPPAYTPTGRYDDDMNGYSAAEQAALDKLDGIQDRIIRVNENGTAEAFKGFIATDGNFYEDPSEMPDGVSPDVDSQGQPKEVWVLDPEASQYSRAANSAHQAQVRLDARRKAGLTQSGDDAAKAYLEAEKTKAGEADRKYGNYMTRMKDLQALNDLPTARSMSVASALNAANTANSKRTHQGSSLATVNAPPPEDYSSQIAGLRDSVAGPVPGQYNIDTSHLPGGKLFPPPDPSIQIPGVPFQSSQSGVAGSLNSGLDPSQLGPQVAPTAQTFTNPFAKLGGR